MVYATSFRAVRVIQIFVLCVVFAGKGDDITLSNIIIFTATKGDSSHNYNPGSMIIIMKMIGINQVFTVSNDVALLSIITLLHELR